MRGDSTELIQQWSTAIAEVVARTAAPGAVSTRTADADAHATGHGAAAVGAAITPITTGDDGDCVGSVTASTPIADNCGLDSTTASATASADSDANADFSTAQLVVSGSADTEGTPTVSLASARPNEASQSLQAAIETRQSLQHM